MTPIPIKNTSNQVEIVLKHLVFNVSTGWCRCSKRQNLQMHCMLGSRFVKAAEQGTHQCLRWPGVEAVQDMIKIPL